MRHILFSLLFLLAPAVVRVRVINNATCDVRIQVLQQGMWRKTIDVPALATRETAVSVPGLETPLTYRVSGAVCRFATYEIAATRADATDVDVVIGDVPNQSLARIRVRSESNR